MSSDSRDGSAVAPNRLGRQFDVAKPDHVWVGDSSSVWTAEGWLYVSTLLDLYCRKVVGWALSSRIDTTLVQDTLQMALGRRHPVAGLLHYADRGSQYASHASQDMLTDHGIVCSMSSKGESVSTMQWPSDSLAVKTRVDGAPLSRHASRGESRYYRLHRNVLQQQTAALVPRVCQSQ
jgi:hypothetical protein